MSGVSKCGLHRSTSRRHSTPSHTNQFGKHSNPVVSITNTSAFLEKIYKEQKASVQTVVESNIFEIKKGTKQGDPLYSLLFNTVLLNSLKGRHPALAKEKRNGNLPERPRPRLPHEPKVRRQRASVRNLQRNSFTKCCATSRKVLKKWVSGSTQKRRKFSATKAALART